MIIAVDELLKDIKNYNLNTLDVKCAVIGLSFDSPNENSADYILSNPKKVWIDEPMFDRIVKLPESWNTDEWVAFLEGLHFHYDDGFGSQHLFGVVWFKDGSWLERDEYDGSEKWVLKRTPDVPQILQRG